MRGLLLTQTISLSPWTRLWRSHSWDVWMFILWTVREYYERGPNEGTLVSQWATVQFLTLRQHALCFQMGRWEAMGKSLNSRSCFCRVLFCWRNHVTWLERKGYSFFHCEVKNPGDKVGQYVSRPGVTNVWLFRRTVSINNSFDKHRIGSLCQSCIG